MSDSPPGKIKAIFTIILLTLYVGAPWFIAAFLSAAALLSITTLLGASFSSWSQVLIFLGLSIASLVIFLLLSAFSSIPQGFNNLAESRRSPDQGSDDHNSGQ